MDTNERNGNDHSDWQVVHTYTRAQAIDDGVLVDVSETAKELGFKYPVAVTVGVMSEVVRPPQIAEERGESVSGRLWDVLWMLYLAIQKKPKANDPDGADICYFQVITTDDAGKAVTHELWSKVGPGDTLDPVLTIMLRSED